MNHVEGFLDHPKFKNTTEEFFFRTGLKLQQVIKKAEHTAFTYRETLYIIPLGNKSFDTMLEILTSRQSDWATLRSLLEMASPISLRDKRIHP